MKKILIAIQTRTDSSRLPQKAHMSYGNKTITSHIIETCQHAANFINRNQNFEAGVRVCLLIPHGDMIKDQYNDIDIIEGDHDDVLSRYYNACVSYDADYIVRITGDCVHMASHVISRCIKTAFKKCHDYTANIDIGPIKRTSMEGLDCEVISKRLMIWLFENAVETSDKEHVTTLVGKSITLPTFPFRVCAVLDPFDLSHIKTSIDTIDDYKNSLNNLHTVELAKREALKYGSYII